MALSCDGARLAGMWWRAPARVGGQGCRREAARRAPQVQRRERPHHRTGALCGHSAPVRETNTHTIRFPLPGCALALKGRAIGARRAPRAARP
jgi:hypothetical protein